jgi:hypothetical protein
MTPPLQSTARAGVAGPRSGITSPRRPAPAPDRPRHLEVVQGRPAPGRRPPRALVLIAVGLIASIVLVIVVARVLTGQAGFTETDLSNRIVQQQRQVEDLQLQIARLRSPQRIYDRATALGLLPASHVVYLTPSPSPLAATSPAASAHTSSASPSAPERGGR